MFTTLDPPACPSIRHKLPVQATKADCLRKNYYRLWHVPGVHKISVIPMTPPSLHTRGMMINLLRSWTIFKPWMCINERKREKVTSAHILQVICMLIQCSRTSNLVFYLLRLEYFFRLTPINLVFTPIYLNNLLYFNCSRVS